MNHTETLAAGLAALGEAFNACLCPICKGAGMYNQTYTIGCGRGTYETLGKCDYCSGKGLRQGDSPAPDSVMNQVIMAARRKLAVEKAES